MIIQPFSSLSLILLSVGILSMKSHEALSFIQQSKAPIPISDEIGCSPTFQRQYFDPLQLATEETFATYREAELKHGRVAMLAVLGNVIPDLCRDTIGIPSQDVLLSPSRDLSFHDIPCGIKALQVVPVIGWIQIILFIGLLETRVFFQQDRRDMPGDYGTGYFGLRDKGQHERSLLSELENGRLAMMAFIIQISLEVISGQTVGEQLKDLMKI